MGVESVRAAVPYTARVGLLIASAVAAIVIAAFVPPFDAPESYYHFADTRTLLGIPNFMDVVSNAGLLLAGALGLAYLWARDGRARLTRPEDRWPYAVFFGGVVLTTFGSAWFHLEPVLADGALNNWGMLWDRLPITVAFMALFAAFIADRVRGRAGLVALPVLIALGIAATAYWYETARAWPGDLRFYSVVQAYPAIAIPLMCSLFPGRHTDGRYVVYMLVWYGLAKLCEGFDGEIYGLLGNTISGHTLKHLLAAVAVYVVLLMLRREAGQEPTTRAQSAA